MPAKPISRPATRRPVNGSPSRLNASTPIIQNGTVATVTAAMPLGTHCSAQMTPPLPMQIVRKPMNARPSHCERGTTPSPRDARIASSRVPAAV